MLCHEVTMQCNSIKESRKENLRCTERENIVKPANDDVLHSLPTDDICGD